MNTPSLSAEALARALGAKRRGKGWRAPCPAHDDRDPSLDIDIGEAGKVLLCCRVGCENEAVIDALRRRGLWAERQPRIDRRRPKNGHAANGGAPEPPLPTHPEFGPAQHRFDYHDVDGHLIGAICRWDKPDGKDIRPAVLQNGRWAWAGFPKPHPLYRLPDLIASPARPVIVVEGEKKAEVARHLVGDFTVTCWPHGASAVAQTDRVIG
jgi:putative DNA primase/helicase